MVERAQHETGLKFKLNVLFTIIPYFLLAGGDIRIEKCTVRKIIVQGPNSCAVGKRNFLGWIVIWFSIAIQAHRYHVAEIDQVTHIK